MGAIEIASSIIIVLTALTYIPSLRSLSTSSNGIPVFATCLALLATQGQLASLALDLRYERPPTIYNLNFRQIGVQWFASLLAFILVIRKPQHSVRAAVLAPIQDTIDTELGQMDVQPATEVTVMYMYTSRDRRPVLWSVGLLVGHAAIVLAVLGVSDKNGHDLFTKAYVHRIDILAFAPIFTIMSALAPALHVRHILDAGQSTGSYSESTLISQAVLFTSVATLWPERSIIYMSYGPSPLWSKVFEWYFGGGFLCINAAIFALGQAAALIAVWYRRHKSVALE